MSSDSEEDCYGNIAQKLQSIKSKYELDKIKTTSLLDSSQSETFKTVDKVIEIIDKIPHHTCEVLKDESDYEEVSLDTIIAQNTKKKVTRQTKRSADISTDNILPAGSRKRTKASKANPSPIDQNSPNFSDISVVETSNQSLITINRRGRGRKGGRRSKNTTLVGTNNATSSDVSNPVSTNSNTTNMASVSAPNASQGTPRGRSRRGRQSNRRRDHDRVTLPDFLSAMFGFGGPSYPTYSVGNTDDYPDESHNQPLFKQPKIDDVVIVENEPELNDSLDENEELSVKVYWQNRECIKFNIRRFQKLQSIFDFFADREKVSHDKLFFTYNDKILKMDDTPDSITYSIAKFIDGGVINQSVSNIVQNEQTAKDGIKLKFQCQNLKKPYEIYVRPEDKLAVAMMRCSEHIEKPLDKLKFLFDGDVISGKNTPKELDLEGGECIDVKIIS